MVDLIDYPPWSISRQPRRPSTSASMVTSPFDDDGDPQTPVVNRWPVVEVSVSVSPPEVDVALSDPVDDEPSAVGARVAVSAGSSTQPWPRKTRRGVRTRLIRRIYEYEPVSLTNSGLTLAQA